MGKGKEKQNSVKVESFSTYGMGKANGIVQLLTDKVADAIFPKLEGQVIGKQIVKLPTGRIVVNIDSMTGSNASAEGVRGFYTLNGWSVEGEITPSISLTPQLLSRPIADSTATIAHELLHAVAHASDIQDTSRQGRYHNKNFGKLVDLVPDFLVRDVEDKKIGVTTKASAKVAIWIKEEIGEDEVKCLTEAYRLTPPPKAPREATTVKLGCPLCKNKVTQSLTLFKGGYVLLCNGDARQVETMHESKAMKPRG